jgi:hypothetical protein
MSRDLFRWGRPGDRINVTWMRAHDDASSTYCRDAATTCVHGREHVASPGDNRHRNIAQELESSLATDRSIPPDRKNLQESCCCVTTRCHATVSKADLGIDPGMRLPPRQLSSLRDAELPLVRDVSDSQVRPERLADASRPASDELPGDSLDPDNSVDSNTLADTAGHIPSANSGVQKNVEQLMQRTEYAGFVPWECHPVRTRPGRLFSSLPGHFFSYLVNPSPPNQLAPRQIQAKKDERTKHSHRSYMRTTGRKQRRKPKINIFDRSRRATK